MTRGPKIFPILLSGGAGTRLWPMSRENKPKPFIRLIGEETLLQQTARRALDAELFEPLTVIAATDHRFTIGEQLNQIGVSDATIVLEPTPRNTAAAAAVAALLVSEASPDGMVLLMPADHLISDADSFRQTVRAAAGIAHRGHFALFGIKPTTAATGYGYIRLGSPITVGASARLVSSFVEKPDQETAEEYLKNGQHVWNSGIFLLPAALFLSELERFEPDLFAAASEALEHAVRETDYVRLQHESFARCRSVSIDYAVMERTDKAAVVPAEFSWTDVGSWCALWSVAERDSAENATVGDVMAWATRNSYIRSDGPFVAALGVEDLIVVATDDAVLIARKEHDQDIGKVTHRLRLDGRKCI